MRCFRETDFIFGGRRRQDVWIAYDGAFLLHNEPIKTNMLNIREHVSNWIFELCILASGLHQMKSCCADCLSLLLRQPDYLVMTEMQFYH